MWSKIELKKLIKNKTIDEKDLMQFIEGNNLTEKEQEQLWQYLVLNNIEIVNTNQEIEEDDSLYGTGFNIILDAIRNTPLLSQKETVELIKRYKNEGDIEARNKLVEHNLRYVVYVIKRHFSRFSHMFDDLFQVGVEGLLYAIDKYDLNKKTQLSTYAYYWINQRIKKYLSENNLIRLPANINKLRNDIQNTYNKLSEKNKRIPSYEEIAKALNRPVSEIMKHSENSYNVISLDASIEIGKDNKQVSIANIIKDDKQDVEKEIIKRERNEELRKLIESLPEKEKYIICHRYGLFGYPEKTLEEIGKDLGLSRERIRQIETKVLRKLRHPIRSKTLVSYFRND